MSVAQLGYVGLAMTDPEEWVKFGTQILGLMEVARDDAQGARFLGMDDAPFRFMIEKADADRFGFAGWDAGSKDNFDALVEKLDKAGATPKKGSDVEAARRAVTEYVSAHDPSGNVFELFHTRTGDAVAFSSPLGTDHFVTGAMGLGHVVLPAPEQDATYAFYKDVLGFGDSDDLHLPAPAEGLPPQRIIFMHADNPRHHSLALYNYDSPTGLVHLMVEVPGIDDVGQFMDRVKAAGVHTLATLGRHSNDNMVSVYVLGPGGIAVEYGYDGAQLDWSSFEPTQSTEGDVWGHEYNFPQG